MAIFYSSSISAFKSFLMHSWSSFFCALQSLLCSWHLVITASVSFFHCKVKASRLPQIPLGLFASQKCRQPSALFQYGSWLKVGIPTFFLEIICLLHFPCSLSRSTVKIKKQNPSNNNFKCQLWTLTRRHRRQARRRVMLLHLRVHRKEPWISLQRWWSYVDVNIKSFMSDIELCWALV